MPLLSFWGSNPDAVLSLSIEQVVANAGAGQLKDNSECAQELRSFFEQVDTSKLADYVDHCLTQSFNKSGFVLQDLVNELGRRLGFTVSNGLYQGTSTAVGNDGLWALPGGHDILVEVKTTDAYRVALDKIAAYRDKLIAANAISKSNSILIVVGRDDTGELEAQVRGSRHAWDMRLISVDALIRLAYLVGQTEKDDIADKVRSILIPVEFTRLDGLIDIVFATAQEAVETAIDTTIDQDPEPPLSSHGPKQADPIDIKRQELLDLYAAKRNVTLMRRSRALYWTASGDERVACAVSKRYAENSAPYWYAYHPAWDKHIAEGSGVYLLGCTDLQIAFAVPSAVMKARISELNTSTRPNGTQYWHVKIIEPSFGKFAMQMPKTGDHLDLMPYVLTAD